MSFIVINPSMRVKKVSQSRSKERRIREDRRKQEVGPPQGWMERRRHVERRLPLVEEDVISPGEWQKYFASYVEDLATKKEEAAAAPDHGQVRPSAFPLPA